MRNSLRLGAAFAAPLVIAPAIVASFAPAAHAQIPGAPSVPRPSLPGAATGPRILFGASDVPALQARRTDAAFAADYQAVKSLVDGRMGAVIGASLGDDLLARVAKGAAFLHALGETPSNTTRYATYRDAAAAALQGIAARTPTTLFGGSGTLKPQEDAGRLQSMTEAYDMLRGSGVAGVDDTAIRARIANWADAMTQDLSLQVNANNISLKAGASLVTAALALADHGSAQTWLNVGVDYVNGCLSAKCTPEGWYGEGPHYVNYSLNNLVSTAYHVRHATGLDWFQAIRPLAQAAIDLRQPDGTLAPFEEGIRNCFPHDVLIGAFAGDAALQGAMAWAWESSPKDTVNYDNQQLHALTRFLFADRTTAAVPPSGPASRALGGLTRIAALRSGWDPGAVQATLFAAQDHSDLELITSRHNVRNPLDLVVHGAGLTLLPTSGGGPTVTTSPNRGSYLDASARNVPLVNRGAPFLFGVSTGEASDTLVSRPAGGIANGLLDATTVEVAPYGTAQRARRTVALVGGTLVVVLDEVTSSAVVDVAIPWRGRGARTVLSAGVLSAGAPAVPELRAATWSYQGAALDASIVGTGALTLASTSGLYAETWGVEETIQGIEARVRSAGARILTLLEPRLSNAGGRFVTAAGGGDTVALSAVTGSTTDLIVAGPKGALHAALGVETDAALAVVRLEAGLPVGAALVGGSRLTYNGAPLVMAGAMLTLAASASGDVIAAEVSGQPAPSGVRVELGKALLANPSGVARKASFAGQGVPAGQWSEAGQTFAVASITGGGTLVIEPGTPAPGGSTGGSSGGSSGGSTGGSSGGATGGASGSASSGGGGCALASAPAAGGPAGALARLASLLLPLGAAALLRRRRS